eukprot:365636-Chlamydomonas_euryale.AAC.4
MHAATHLDACHCGDAPVSACTPGLPNARSSAAAFSFKWTASVGRPVGAGSTTRPTSVCIAGNPGKSLPEYTAWTQSSTRALTSWK